MSRKHNCVCQLSTVTNYICTVAELTMLGLSFDTKYKWQPHINNQAKSLTNSIKTRKNAIVEYLDYQIPVTQLYGDVQAAKRD